MLKLKGITVSRWQTERAHQNIRRVLFRRVQHAAHVLLDSTKRNISMNVGWPGYHSLEGEYPYFQTGDLTKSGHNEEFAAQDMIEVTFETPYAISLEKMRPYLRRTFDERQSELLKIVRKGTGVRGGRFHFGGW